jgi:hypothetical protein
MSLLYVHFGGSVHRHSVLQIVCILCGKYLHLFSNTPICFFFAALIGQKRENGTYCMRIFWGTLSYVLITTYR